MVNIGELIGGENADKGYFLNLKVHWGDVAREILDKDQWAIHHMNVPEFARMVNSKYKNIIKSAAKMAIANNIKEITRSLDLKCEHFPIPSGKTHIEEGENGITVSVHATCNYCDAELAFEEDIPKNKFKALR